MSEEIEFNDVVERVKDALAGATATTGATMLPTETADEIIAIVYERNFMRGLFPSLPMSRRTVNVPSLTGSIAFHEQTLAETQAGTAQAESSQTTGELVMTLKTMIANVPVGNYLIAYGVEGLLSVLRDDIASRLAYNEQSLLLNGDTVITNGYVNNINGLYHASTNPTGTSATVNDYLQMFDGLRKSAGTSVLVSGTFALSHVREAINGLGVYAENRDDLAMIVPRNLEVQLLGMTELQTVDKYGAGATILTGEIGKIYGISVFATSALATNLGWDGTFDGTAAVATKTTALLLHRRSPLIGNPVIGDRRFSIDFHDEPTKDRFVLIPRQDIAFGVRYANAICRFNGINTV
tara:strand:+ start:4662 stop:5717 length:1056 start_codon:yes stop_codon:yes gene_type:complete